MNSIQQPILFLLSTVTLLLISCNNIEDNNGPKDEEEIHRNDQNPIETRRLELIDKIANNTISTSEQKELDSLENEKYKKVLF